MVSSRATSRERWWNHFTQDTREKNQIYYRQKVGSKKLGTIVLKDANGTIRLNKQADTVARKTLAINVGRTSKLK
jgi:hypothetical protein